MTPEEIERLLLIEFPNLERDTISENVWKYETEGKKLSLVLRATIYTNRQDNLNLSISIKTLTGGVYSIAYYNKAGDSPLGTIRLMKAYLNNRLSCKY